MSNDIMMEAILIRMVVSGVNMDEPHQLASEVLCSPSELAPSSFLKKIMSKMKN